MWESAPTVELSEQLCKVSFGFLPRAMREPFVAFFPRRNVAS
jgi:hypothetical protein